MLEKLSQAIKKATDKLANAIFLDKNLVDSIVRELQRALIEADVNILLVKQLSDKIKKAAQDERIKGIEKKEHIIKLLHDELIKILGKYKPLKLQSGKTQNKILFLGLYGAGKCVHEKTKIQLSGGDIIKAKDIYNKYKNKLKEESLEDGKIINIEDEELLVPSYNPLNQQIENKRVTHLWKLKKDELMEVKLNNGNDFSIKVTPEHPFFVLQNGEVTQKRADQLTEQDFISIPNRINIIGRQVNIFDEIKNLNLDVYLSKEEIKDNLPKDKTLKEVCQSLKHKRNYCHFTKTLKEGKLPIELINSKNHNFLKIKDKNSKKIISLPLFITPEFAEFIGYVIGDGNLRENSIGISSEDSKVIKRVIELSKILFNITPSLIKDKRTNNLYQIRVNSNTLVKIFKIFGLTPGRKGKNLYIPNQITQSNDEIVRSFLRAYFDCDSHPSKNKRYIELTSESHIILQQIHMLLKRFGIISTISKKMINKIPYWRLSIKARYAEQYSNKIGYLIKRKQKVIEKYSNMGLIQGSGNQDMIPLGKTLKALRLQLGFSIGEIQSNAVYSYGIYEEKGFISKENLKKLIAYYKIKKKGFIWEILQDIANNIKLRDKYSHEIINGTFPHLINENLIEKTNGQLLLTEKSQKILQLINENQIQFNNIFSSLEKIADSNICWLPVKEINKIKNNSEYVYDLTVEDNHSFVAEGFIVHNTTTIAKLGNYFQKRGNKVALVGLDVHRPAAKEQLKQLAEKNNLTSFIDEKEADAIQTWKNFEPKLKDYNVVLIDTAGRHTLDQELITEISSLNRAINPTEAILVMPADIGQAAKPQAEQFKEALQITGVIITRMDSTAKGGGALTACAETHAPVYFITTGEKINDIEEFNPKTFLSRLLGMGDLNVLIEKIRSATDEKKQAKIQKNLEKGKLTLNDVVEQVKSMNSLGGLDKIKGLIPGFGNLDAKIPENLLENQQEKIAKWEHIIKSMTPEEKENPEILEKQTSRISRIAKGSGVHNSDIRSLLKQYKMLNEMVKSSASFDPEKPMSQKQMMKLAKKFMKGKKFRI